ncbi:hypothetical protein RI367_003259 [Sorochytrium milnesiophthora]
MSTQPTVKVANEDVPGEPLSGASKLSNVGSGALQSFKPVSSICQHICGFHKYNGEMRPVHINEDMRQCLIFDSPEKGAKLIGVEYIINRKLFETLPMEERRYWHSHIYEVKGGLIHCPNAELAPRAAVRPVELRELETVVDSYGKTFHFWQVDRGDVLPLGAPTVMMSFTGPGQLPEHLLRQRDEQLKVNTQDLIHEREYIKPQAKVEGADHWEAGGAVWQLELVDISKKKQQ